jgi:hypothetical protein
VSRDITHEPRDADRIEPTAHSISRRLLERFGLISLGLYHLPLLLNTYPSRGGGGFNDDGLAVRWGHVFTPPGVWVARHLFHMTGPMSGAYRGDNGDVGEEFGRLLLGIVIAAIGATAWTIADRRRPRGRWVEGALQLLLRYSIALGIVSYGIAKILPVQFPALPLNALDARLGDLPPMSLLWSFMEYSRPYAFFGGLMECVVVVLLLSRRTATLGALVCLAVMTNVALLNWAYGVPVKLYSTMIVVSAAVLVLYDARRLLAVFVENRTAAPASHASDFQDRVPAQLRWIIKLAVVGSVVVSSVVAMTGATGARGQPSAVDGRWVVTSFARDGQSSDSPSNPSQWRRLVVDGGGATIRLATDSLIRCQRLSADDASLLKLSCSRNRAGELHWTRTANQLQLSGTFDGAHVTASAQYLDRSEYLLLRSRFRLITDR